MYIKGRWETDNHASGSGNGSNNENYVGSIGVAKLMSRGCQRKRVFVYLNNDRLTLEETVVRDIKATSRQYEVQFIQVIYKMEYRL
jgi:hypothetical protein